MGWHTNLTPKAVGIHAGGYFQSHIDRMNMHDNHHGVASLLLASRDSDAAFWKWLVPGQPVSRKDGNKFFLACILDYQMSAETVWKNAQRFAEEILGDPDDLWHVIVSITLDEWLSRKSEYKLHRFTKAHERVYTIGAKVVSRYQGDARAIWQGQSLEATLYRLNDLRVGEQISRMIAGALVDTGHLQGSGDVKADIHVCRVLGRLVKGNAFTPDEVVEITRTLHPTNPWLLDRPLYRIGKSVCNATAPDCSSCHMNKVCRYANGTV